MKSPPKSHPRAHTRVICSRGHRHDVCVAVTRGLPPGLRCGDQEPDGYTYGTGGGGCTLPTNLEERVMRELRENLQECIRRGRVVIKA